MELYVNPTITGFRQDVDGTIKELKIGSNKEDAYENIIEQGADAKLDKNKTATINVSTYTEPVEILPTSGKDGMKKATITLSNIPSPSVITSVTFYAWKSELDKVYVTMSATPEVGDNSFGLTERNTVMEITPYDITAVGEGTITVDDNTYSRYTDGDFTLSNTPTP